METAKIWRGEGIRRICYGNYQHTVTGITLSDGPDIGIGLEYANDGMKAKSDANDAATGDYQLGGVTSIKYNSLNSAPHVRFGVIDVPTADTVDRHATGVVNGISVEYVEEGESAQSYIEDGHIHVAIKKFGGGDGSLPWGSGSQDGSVPGWGSGGSDGSAGQGECGCAAKWQALEAWKASIEARLAALENGGGGGGCNCQCLAAGLMDEIQAAIDEAVGKVGADFLRLNFHMVAAQLTGAAPMLTVTEADAFTLTTRMILSFDAVEGMEWKPGTSVTLVEAQKGMVIDEYLLTQEYDIYQNGDPQKTVMATANLVLEQGQGTTKFLKLVVPRVPEPTTGTLSLLALASLAARRCGK